MTSLKTSIKTITYLSDIGCLEIQGASLQPETATHHCSSSSGKFIMQTQYVLKQEGLTLPVTKLFQQHIATLLAEQSQQTSVRAVVINFRNPDYSAESGGFHPVEIR